MCVHGHPAAPDGYTCTLVNVHEKELEVFLDAMNEPISTLYLVSFFRNMFLTPKCKRKQEKGKSDR